MSDKQSYFSYLVTYFSWSAISHLPSIGQVNIVINKAIIINGEKDLERITSVVKNIKPELKDNSISIMSIIPLGKEL